LNGHVRAEALRFEEVHDGYGFGNRNLEGELLLGFAETMDLIVINTWFQNGDRQKITYKSRGYRTVSDYVLVRRCDRVAVSDVKVIGSEAYISQHKINAKRASVKRKCRKKEKGIESKCRILRLKDADLNRSFCEKVHCRTMEKRMM
jgi:hypothetical protein